MRTSTGYSYRRKNRYVRLGLVDRKGRRKILHDKDIYTLEMRSTGGKSFADLRKNYIVTKRSITPVTMGAIVDIYFKLTYGFYFHDVSCLYLEDGRRIVVREKVGKE